jgi:hypothetical protein
MTGSPTPYLRRFSAIDDPIGVRATELTRLSLIPLIVGYIPLRAHFDGRHLEQPFSG